MGADDRTADDRREQADEPGDEDQRLAPRLAGDVEIGGDRDARDGLTTARLGLRRPGYGRGMIALVVVGHSGLM